jgi:phage head maturation protease
MIEKVAEYTQNEREDQIFTIYNGSKDLSLIKTASYASEVASYIESLEKENGYLYALVNALTAGEYYGSNRNGDFFPEEALKKHHGTFVDHGYVYKHHVNKDPKKSMGRVIFSHFNDQMKRVELVVKLREDHKDVQKILNDIKKGKVIKTSMGCRVPYDVCSITKKKAKTRKDYSAYLLNNMNEILPDGRKVYAINTKPTFFDISIVTIPADPVSSFMSMLGGVQKTASYDKTSEDKSAEIKKKLEGEMDWVADDPKGLIRASQPRMTQEEIEKLSSYPLNESLSTLMALRIMPIKEDFQKLALYSVGQKEMADQLEKEGQVFEINLDTVPEEITDIGPEKANEKIASVLKENISDYCLTKPAIINRLIKQASINDKPMRVNPKETERSFIKRLLFDEPQVQPKSSGVKNPLLPMATLGTLYAGYAKLFGNTANASGFTNFVSKNP